MFHKCFSCNSIDQQKTTINELSLVLAFFVQAHGYFEKSSPKHPLAYTLTTSDLLKWCNGGGDDNSASTSDCATL